MFDDSAGNASGTVKGKLLSAGESEKRVSMELGNLSIIAGFATNIACTFLQHVVEILHNDVSNISLTAKAGL